MDPRVKPAGDGSGWARSEPNRMECAAMAQTDAAHATAVLGIDTGGTFTDVTLIDPASGRMWNAKTPSTPADPSVAFGAGIAEVLRLSGLADGDIARVLHGTTIATNLILERKG